MFGIKSDNGYHEVLSGVKIKTLTVGDKMLMTEFVLTKGSVLPEHHHPYEQTGYLISGAIELFIDSRSLILKPGDSWNISENIGHKAIILENSVAIEIFTPARQDYEKYIFEKDCIR